MEAHVLFIYCLWTLWIGFIITLFIYTRTQYSHFIIKAGQRKPDGFFIRPFFFKDSFMFKIQLSSSCWYQLHNDDYIETNKICGIQTGLNKYDTYQIGWLPDYYVKGQFWLYINYYGPNNRREFILIDTISSEDVYTVKFRLLDDKLIVSGKIATQQEDYVVTSSNTFAYKTKALNKIGLYKYPSHGSIDPAPHTYRLHVEQIM